MIATPCARNGRFPPLSQALTCREETAATPPDGDEILGRHQRKGVKIFRADVRARIH